MKKFKVWKPVEQRWILILEGLGHAPSYDVIRPGDGRLLVLSNGPCIPEIYALGHVPSESHLGYAAGAARIWCSCHSERQGHAKHIVRRGPSLDAHR